MAWYNPFRTKLNPAQPYIGKEESPEQSLEPTFSYELAYEKLEVVNRGVNMLVDDAASIPVAVGDQTPGLSTVKGVKKVTVNKLLNYEPNFYQDISTFKRNIITDYILDGNIFIYWDGVHLYHLPASKVVITPSSTTYIKNFVFEGKETFSPNEIIHIKENSFHSIYRGVSRLRPALSTMQLMTTMKNFQSNFFTNGAVPGLVIESPNTLSEKIKQRMIQSWVNRYRPDAGGKRPLILDGGLKVAPLAKVNFQELDFQSSIETNEKIVLKALGIPPIMLDSGNNANLRPNMRMYYLETVLPIVRKINSAYERFFGFEIVEDVTDVPALQPELRDQADYYSTLVNGGILTPNEGRDGVGKEPIEGLDEIRVPANIAGSAADPSQGGRPEENNE